MSRFYKKKLQTVQVAVILIGKSWLDSKDEFGQQRLDNPDDWVRIEIETLLDREIRVIPVLVAGAVLPKSEQLPEPLIPLVRRQAIEIRDTHFHRDVDKLIQTLRINKLARSWKTYLWRFIRFSIIITFILFIGLTLIIFRQFDKDEYVVVTKEPETVAKVTTESQPESYQPSSSIVTETKPTLVLDFEPQMVRIPPGKFRMGSPETEQGRSSDEGPQRTVTIGYAFEISQTEITFAQYDVFANETQRKLPDDNRWGRGNRPVIHVSFVDVQAYVLWLSKKTGKQYRLLTEAEWEYVARAGSTTAYWWGDDIGQNNAVCAGCDSQWDKQSSAPVGSFKPNAFGVYDTAGNVWEWTQDCWHENYQNAPIDGSAWLQSHGGNCDRRVVRGGSWGDGPRGLRSAGRNRDGSDEANNNLGFRVARDL